MSDRRSGPSRLIVLTGGPGTGKTTLLDRIRGQIRCLDEPAREVLAAERASGGDGTWDRDPARFVELLLQRSIENYEQALRWEEVVVFDRGIPDCIVYAIRAGIDQTPSRDAAQAFPYEREVFFLNPWSDIYETDEERIMSFEDTVSFGRSLRDVYREFGYTLIDVPRGSVDERAGFITRRMPDDAGTPEPRAKAETSSPGRGPTSARLAEVGPRPTAGPRPPRPR